MADPVGSALGVSIGVMRAEDAADVAALAGELGYPAEADQLRRRLAALATRPDNCVFVARIGPEVAGWCHVMGVRLLESEGYAEIGGLVVASRLRRRGVGRALLNAAEQWAASAGYDRMRLRSGTHRHDAHAFYERVGYARAKASFAFERGLGTGH